MEESRYYCSPEWHLARLRHAPFASLLYTFALRIAKGNRFHGSVVGLAEYFNVSRWKVQRAIRALLVLGFFEVIAREPFKPVSYRVVLHKDWVAKHPSCCTVKEQFPWSAEQGDKLGVRLWNASGGKIGYQTYQLAALRRTGLTDDEIVASFSRFVAAEEEQRQKKGWHGRWTAVKPRFLRWLQGSADPRKVEALGLEPFQRTTGTPILSVAPPTQSVVASVP